MRRFAPIGWLWLLPGLATAGEGDRVEFNRDVRPILAERCYGCHGPDKAARKAGLRLDDRAAALEKAAIEPGRPDESELIARVASADPDEVMPPPGSTKALSEAERQTLARWIAEGATYQAHWAYEPIRAPGGPASIDGFIRRGLEPKGLAPSPRADAATLIRRLSLDLVGLPPAPADVARFAADPSDAAYAREVDRLLASEHYGERMAVPWLDLVRFADTVGYHGDQNQHAFPYRDYVIDAFNRNLPFDRFTAEQLAGDLLPDPTPAQLVASGFNRLNMMTREGGAQPGEYLAKYAADRVRTVAITWMGSTLGCAECHDHKYDPFTARDFYRLSAFFADIEQWGVYMDYVYTPNPDLRGYSNDHPFPPEIDVESPYLKRRLAAIDRRANAVRDEAIARLAADPARLGAAEAWAREIRQFLGDHPDGWEIAGVRLESDAAGVARGDRSFPISGRPKEEATTRISIDPGVRRIASIRLDLRGDRDRPPNGFDAGLIRLSAAVRAAGGGPDRALAIAEADANLKIDRYENGSAVSGIREGWKLRLMPGESDRSGVYVLDRPLELAPGDLLTIEIKGGVAALARLAVSPLADPATAGLFGAIRTEPAAEEGPIARAAYLRSVGDDPAALAALRRLDRERAECRGGRAASMIVKRREPIEIRILPRGNWLDRTGEVVAPGVPAFLPQPAGGHGRRLDRLDLARWLTAADNPLTARVFVNRLWKQFFGAGLSGVMEDVGAQGEWPSHPELLDFLADGFRRDWDVKRLVRRIVMSDTYRQDSRPRPELRESDPGNRLLAAQSPRRLDAEFVRDNALAVAGLLDPEVGGPSSFPYQPSGYYAVLQFPNRDYAAHADERQYRRGLYTHWQRTFLQPMLANFDAPSREECIAARNAANTPQQALTLLNDPTFVEAARQLAANILADGGPVDDDARIGRIYRRALARSPRPREVDSLRRFLDARRAGSGDDDPAKFLAIGNAAVPPGLDARELAAWAEVGRVVLNLHETITRY